ncbi:5-methyltetrahydropteroyltriglutamate--homocysteine S-methyltransferase [Bombilactobacillus folatiphilus]|uniref:5-methyltetrahydropteroyltriglutamate--homocysteine S-methyltransferase n=1 Tax=Bombilactobacillus folatiphilus TaxID=2923362 RepID=A0ABY4P8N4_9LACO|nr:5-methyltetrahydropteroyltriglutamate--homocysteine S-methyltransferase [Bombilactobacillus folatiphilus]UQS81886.1 5-methyltetrahydropteroyltriglutamate--homocysteine S-methyltransferase [Bombilactobacillus folatiphilus]
MTKFKPRTQSPFYYDIIGSFLRPQELKQARADLAQGKISQADLKQVEDQAIIDLLRQEEQVGLQAVTDGEFRRSWWHLDFFWGFEGLNKAKAINGYQFHDEETRNETVKLTGKIKGNNHPFVEHFKFTKAHVSPNVQVKQTMPSPGQLLFELQRPENQADVKAIYSNEDDLLQDIADAYLQVLQDLVAAGCRTVQFDDCTWGALIDWQENHTQDITPDQIQQLKQTLVTLNNAVIDQAPQDLTINTHVCRGNYHSTWAAAGGYDSIADPLFTSEHVNAYYLEYDTKRSGGFEPLKQVGNQKQVVLGLITTKDGTLEDQATIIQRVYEASQYIPLENLALSPQCGFASTEEGNVLTAEQQWAKIRLIEDIAREIWH